MPDREGVEQVRAYYEKILPFYEKESAARTDLAFWRGLARRWNPGRILEIGSGLGRITEALSQQAPAVGIDVSLEMLRRARRRSRGRSRASFLAADMREVVFERGFDLIVAPSDPFSHWTRMEDRRRALRSVADQLSPRGRFVLDGLYRRREFDYPERLIRHSRGVLRVAEAWRPMGAHDLWRASYRYRDRGRGGKTEATLEASFLARAWNPEEISSFFDSCGLAIEELWGDFEGRPFRGKSKRLIVVARRRERFVRRGQIEVRASRS